MFYLLLTLALAEGNIINYNTAGPLEGVFSKLVLCKQTMVTKPVAQQGDNVFKANSITFLNKMCIIDVLLLIIARLFVISFLALLIYKNQFRSAIRSM